MSPTVPKVVNELRLKLSFDKNLFLSEPENAKFVTKKTL